jgi:hypothetical protein
VSGNRKEFTYAYYTEFLARLAGQYTFISFREGKDLPEKDNRPYVILRHDIDMDLESALQLSLLEKNAGIISTYFFLVRNPLYNIFSGSGAELVKGILANGHRPGLHFDCALYDDIDDTNINDYIRKEVCLIENFFDRPVEAVSFHRPGSLEMSGVEIGELPSTYEKVFLERFDYFSDSKGEWARGNPLRSGSFAESKNLHILAHPVWWNETPMTPFECLTDVLGRLGSRAEEYVAANCLVWDRDRPDRRIEKK